MKTQYGKSGVFLNIEFGKPVILPLIRNNVHMTNRQNYETSATNFISLQKNSQNNNLKNPLTTIQDFHRKKKKSLIDIIPAMKAKSEEQQIHSSKQIQRVRSQRNMSLHPIQMIGAYRLGTVIGKGSGAVVRKVKSWKGGVYAMKTYEKFNEYDSYKRKNIQNQIEILESLDHPSVLKYIQTITTPTSINIVTQIIEKKSLGEWLRNHENGRASDYELKTIMRNLLKVLAYLSEKGIAHRDIKLDNILISRELEIKLIDFGFSVKHNQILYDFCGTPHYMSPEIISKGGYIGQSADIWAAGVLFYKLATGTFPFKGMNDKILFRKICRGEVTWPSYITSKTERIINRMLCLDYSQRPKANQLLKESYFSQ